LRCDRCCGHPNHGLKRCAPILQLRTPTNTAKLRSQPEQNGGSARVPNSEADHTP
jgi:hypothetical protein